MNRRSAWRRSSWMTFMKHWANCGQSGLTILLTEQNALRALQLADRGYILQEGRIVLEGSGKDLMKNNLVKKAYLGR